jgi:TonB-linked SusC/RagA family outer membrane protein
MTKYLSLILLLVFSMTAFAQERLITGKVTDESGQGIPGVTIQLKGTSTGTTTDLDGAYKIKMNAGTLRFSFIGFIAQEINVTNQSTINVVLLEETRQLNEVVVIGYGTQKKKDLSTAVSVVGEKEIKDRPLVSAAQAIQGKAAGVQVIQPSGKPGVGLSVRVRGTTSIEADNEPLYVVDGVPTKDVSGLSPSDIASMSILKDASSASIYGARAANGVVIITTKKGTSNEQTVSLNTYFGISKLRKVIDVLNTKQYRDLMLELPGTSYNPAWTGYTKWTDEVFGTGFNQSYQLSTSGGSEKLNYYVSGGYLSDQGIVQPSKFDRYSFRLNLDSQVKPWFRAGTNLNIIRINTKDTPDNLSSGRGGVIMSALNTPPFLSIYKADGSGAFAQNPFQPSWENPVAYMEGPDQNSIDNKIFGSFNTEISFIKELKLNSRFGIEMNNHQWDYYLDPYRTTYGRDNKGIAQADKYNALTWLVENILEYNKSLGSHSFNAMLGTSAQRSKYNDSFLYGTHMYSNTSVTTLNAANEISGSTSIEEYSLVSFFGRVAYNYNSKYYLTASMRRDGSSKLAHHWGTMPSFSAAWRVSSEDFMKDISFIDDLKIRGGWGVTGNQEGLSNYTQYGLLTIIRDENNVLPASYQSSFGNPDLKWETTHQSNIGLDLTLFNARVTFIVDAYIKKTKDLILKVQWPSTLNLPELRTNAGEMENKGIEFNLSTVNVDKKIKWTSDFNISFNKNEVTYLKYVDVAYYGRIYSNNEDVVILREGLPLGSFYGLTADGVDPATGMMKYKDLNNNGKVDGGDRSVIGNAQPKFTYGFTNNISFKRFDLNIFFQGSQGNDIFNATRVDLEGMFDSKNQSVAVLDRWTPENTDTDMPKAVGGGNVDNVRNSTRFIEDGSYLRLKSLTLSYRLLQNNPKFNNIKRVSVYATGQNLVTITKYSGFDPEVNAYGNDAVQLGIDYGTYPQVRSLILGINVDF